MTLHQHDYNLANEDAPTFRTDANAALTAILNLNNGATAPTTTAPGMLWYQDTTGIVWQRNAADSGWDALWKIGNTLIPKNYVYGPPPTWNSVAQVKIKSGFHCYDSLGKYPVTYGSDITVDITTSAAINGRDTSTAEASNTWYHLYAVWDSTGTNPAGGVLSPTNEKVSGTITLPSGYDSKRQLIAIRNDNSSNFINFVVGQGWPGFYFQKWQVNTTLLSGVTAGDCNVLNGGTADAAFHAASLASFVSPNSTMARVIVAGAYSATAREVYIRATGSALTRGFCTIRTHASNEFPVSIIDTPTDASQSIDYEISGTGSTAYIDVDGFFARI